MPQRDALHDLVRLLLEQAGWTITHDPLYLKFGERKTFVDLVGETTLGAQKQERKIAVEIKSFLGSVSLSELEKGIGQFMIYRSLLSVREPERETYIALPFDAFESLLANADGQVLIQTCQLKFIIFDDQKKVITRWID